MSSAIAIQPPRDNKQHTGRRRAPRAPLSRAGAQIKLAPREPVFQRTFPAVSPQSVTGKCIPESGRNRTPMRRRIGLSLRSHERPVAILPKVAGVLRRLRPSAPTVWSTSRSSEPTLTLTLTLPKVNAAESGLCGGIETRFCLEIQHGATFLFHHSVRAK